MAAASFGSATASAASLSLIGNKSAHPTLRLDSFLRTTDAGYQHGEAQTHGDRFVRRMATYGNVRPSPCFISEPRVARAMKQHNAVDMSNLPATWHDPRGEKKEGRLEYPGPPKDMDDSFMKLYSNHSLMLPSERYQEHLLMKEKSQKFKEDREQLFRYKKRLNVLNHHYPHGVVGLDGPLHPDTELYADRRQHLLDQAERKAVHGEQRHANLFSSTMADDSTAQRDYGGPHQLKRSQVLGIQSKRVDPEEHPHRFLNTHDRLFPTDTATWDPERASVLRSHEVRDRRHNIINGASNAVDYRVAGQHGLAEQAPDPLSRSAPCVVPQ